MFINDWARAYRWQLAAPEFNPSYSSMSFPVMDKSILITGSKARREWYRPSAGGQQGKSGRGEVKLDQRAGVAARTAVLELSASSAVGSHPGPTPPLTGATEEGVIKAKLPATVPIGLDLGLEPLPSCLALQQLPSGGWTPTLGRMRQVGIDVPRGHLNAG